MKDSISAFPAATRASAPRCSRPTVLPDGTKQFELDGRGHEMGGVTGQDRRGHGLQRHGPRPDHEGRDPGDHVRIVLHNKLPESTSIHFHG